MSPMLDIEKRHADVFRIRIGDKEEYVDPKDGKTKVRARKLTDSIRITSHNRGVVNAFAAVFGGEPCEWDGAWEVYIPGNTLPVLVLPGQSISQWWEFYKGSVCERRCDGYTETKTNKPCVCPPEIEARLDDKKRWCQPTTRINVVCPDVEVVGAGSLVTHSMVAAETLPQAVAIAEQALSHGLMVPAVLRVVEHVGKGRRYIVPQLEIVGISLTQLASGEVPSAAISARPNLALAPPADIDQDTHRYHEGDDVYARRRKRANAELGRLGKLGTGTKGHENEPGCCERHDRIATATGGATRTTDRLTAENLNLIVEHVDNTVAGERAESFPAVEQATLDKLRERIAAMPDDYRQALRAKWDERGLRTAKDADGWTLGDYEQAVALVQQFEDSIAEAGEPPQDAA